MFMLLAEASEDVLDRELTHKLLFLAESRSSSSSSSVMGGGQEGSGGGGHKGSGGGASLSSTVTWLLCLVVDTRGRSVLLFFKVLTGGTLAVVAAVAGCGGLSPAPGSWKAEGGRCIM